MSTPAGILAASSAHPPTGAVRFELDPRRHRFLRDHLVGGRALLSTVMGIETMAGAVRHARPEAWIDSITDIRVGPPYLVPGDGPGGVEVTVSGGATLRCQVRSDAAEPHFTAAVILAKAETTATQQPDSSRPGLPPVRVSGEVVYGLYFHGPSFRVIGSAGVDGATAVARLARRLPSIIEPARRSITAPLLIELCLQTAGLWDLAAGDGMTIPRSIDRVRRFSDLDSDASMALFAVVEAGADHLGRRFDARVVDDEGRVHIAVDGYRTVPFGHPYDLDAAARIGTALGHGTRDTAARTRH